MNEQIIYLIKLLNKNYLIVRLHANTSHICWNRYDTNFIYSMNDTYSMNEFYIIVQFWFLYKWSQNNNAQLNNYWLGILSAWMSEKFVPGLYTQ